MGQQAVTEQQVIDRLAAFWAERERIRAGLTSDEARWSVIFGPTGLWEVCIADLAKMGISRNEALAYTYSHQWPPETAKGGGA